jgi:hypothetical protein
MTKKTVRAYKDVFSFIKNKGLMFDELISDFEPALRRAIKETFVGIKLGGCHFHLGKVYSKYVLRKH